MELLSVPLSTLLVLGGLFFLVLGLGVRHRDIQAPNDRSGIYLFAGCVLFGLGLAVYFLPPGTLSRSESPGSTTPSNPPTSSPAEEG
jgi:hypothetical protein